MKFVCGVQISRFRSIKSAELTDLAGFTALAGVNNAGKSNALRALNAFFNGETDAGQRVDTDVDYYAPDADTTRRKRIRVAVSFSLSEPFNYRSGLASVEALLGSEFTLAKEWAPLQPQPEYYLNDTLLEADGRREVDKFLQLIDFRYVPNRVLPLELIRNEGRAVRRLFLRRLARRGLGAGEAFNALRETSDSLLADAAQRISGSCPSVGEMRLDTPTSWSDLAFAVGYRFARGDVELEDSVQGAGIQSMLMFETLRLIDMDRFQTFGWRQAAFWAVEEPESSLHVSLQARLAAYLRSLAFDPKSRLQVLCTTHSDVMIQHAENVIIAAQGETGSIFETIADTREALRRCSSEGVAPWRHPLHLWPLDPLILVEGKHDKAFLDSAFTLVGSGRVPRVTYLGELTADASSGGVDANLKYVRANAEAIKARAYDAPVIVVLDWESAGRRGSFERLFQAEDPFAVRAWPDDSFNPRLADSFRGIERYYSDRMIDEARGRGAQISERPDGNLGVESQQYASVKQALFDVVADGLKIADLVHARPFLDEILRTAGLET